MATGTGLNPHVEDVLSTCLPLWKEASGLPERRLLRLAVLRDLIRTMHAERSRLLALSEPERADALRRVEPRIEALKQDALERDSLPELVLSLELGGTEARAPKSAVPPELEEAVGNGKFTRYDRKWEAEIAAEAYRMKWSFWSLEAWIDIARAENFHQSLNQALWPEGIVLFVEACSDSDERPPESSSDQPIWKGRWLLAHSRRTRPFERNLGPLPGALRPPRQDDWQLIFATGNA